ncbi:MAG: antibiotic biosynthesis monooxygenase [Peptostreptococcus sp.]|uniref:putative quinol monooxygenase n=1 Tax=Peptostreptococcus sp. TaxID=1262 RepID=UPI002FC6EAA7
MKRLNIYVRYTSKKDCRDKFLNEVDKNDILDKIRSEDGCIMYEYFVSMDKDNQILLVESWEDESYQIEHMKQEHMKKLKEIKDKYILETYIDKI